MNTTTTMPLSASLEDYLEAILQIVRDKQAVRAKDIGKRLSVGRSSVTGALHALAERTLINYAPYDVITLTTKGREAAEDVVRRHEALRRFFIHVLGVNEQDADAAACKLEHAIPESLLERFVQFGRYVERNPRGGGQWLQGFCAFYDQECAVEHRASSGQAPHDAVRSKDVETPEQPKRKQTLSELKRGHKASILSISGTGGVRRRLLDMGVTAGTLVEVERVAPLGDPIEVRIKGYRLTLRKEEAERIAITPL